MLKRVEKILPILWRPIMKEGNCLFEQEVPLLIVYEFYLEQHGSRANQNQK